MQKAHMLGIYLFIAINHSFLNHGVLKKSQREPENFALPF